MERRSFLRGAAALVGASALPLLFSRKAWAGGYGALVPDPRGIVDLPAGFSYKILERRNDPMTDGYRVPGRPDGMACFPGPGGTLVLMRNHENGAGERKYGPYGAGQAPPPEAYDPAAMGGVTRLVVDATRFDRISSNLVLIGTARNCAGGVSPWGWLTCEENADPRHGYVFLCRTDAETVQPPRRITGYGRFYHEAATVDPSTRIAYLTEDRSDGCLYRFVPSSVADPFVGKLQALAVIGRDGFEASSDMAPGVPVPITWVDLADPDSAGDTLREEAQSKGAATISRGEGIWFHEGMVSVCSTNGGPVSGGQILQLTTGASPSLALAAQSTDRDVLDMPDNITVAPWGEIVMAEDNGRSVHIRGMTPAGQVYDLARNAVSDSEFCGVCFSPDGKAMFVNIQEDGLTLVITGPFGRWAGDLLTGDPAIPGGEGSDASQSILVRAAVPIAALAGVVAVGAGLRRRASTRGSR